MNNRSPRIFANQLLGSLFDSCQNNMSESWREWVMHRASSVLVPTVEYYSSLPPQEPLFSLYYVIHPVRLSGKCGQRLFGRAP
jgi:hypothetical protein